MVIFHCYVSLPEGTPGNFVWEKDDQRLLGKATTQEETWLPKSAQNSRVAEALINEILADLRGCPYVAPDGLWV